MSKGKSKQSGDVMAPPTNRPEAEVPAAKGASKDAKKKASDPKSEIPRAKPKATAERAERPTSKLEQVVTLLKGKNGATIDELMKATDWQAHSVRGAISGAIKKRLGLKVTSQVRDGARTYRIER